MLQHALFICTLSFLCYELPEVVTFSFKIQIGCFWNRWKALELQNKLVGRIELFDAVINIEKSKYQLLDVCGGFLVFFDSFFFSFFSKVDLITKMRHLNI